MDVLLDKEDASSGLPEDGLVRYLREVGRAPLLSRSEEQALLLRSRAGDRRALNELVTANLKWVVGVCGEYRDRGLPMAELIAEGNLGLIRAARRFAPGQGSGFTAYAVWRIRRGLERALKEHTRYRSAGAASEGGRETPPLPHAARPPPAGEGGNHSRTPASPVGRLSRAICRSIHRALDRVAEPGRTVLKLSFGLGAGRPMGLEEIGRILGVDAGRAGYLKIRAIRQLRMNLQEPRHGVYREARDGAFREARKDAGREARPAFLS